MILVDCNGYLCTDSKIKVTAFGDEPETRYNLLVARRISPANHVVTLREPDMTAKERALTLLGRRIEEGQEDKLIEGIGREDISISLRLSSDPVYQGFTVFIPPGNYGPDCLLQEVIRKWMALFPGLRDLTEEEDVASKRKAPLMIYREPSFVRPARVQIELCSAHAIDAEYWLRPMQLKYFAEHISRAINEYDDLYDQCLKQGVFDFSDKPAGADPDPSNSDEDEDEKGADASTPRRKKKKKVLAIEETITD